MTRSWHRILIAASALAGATVLSASAVPMFAAGSPGVAGARFLAARVSPAPPVPAVPLLRVTMTDAVSTPRSGDVLGYAITVADRDRVALPMQIRLAAPVGLGDLRVADGGTLVGRELTWSVSLVPGQEVTVHFTAAVHAHASRLATTACAYLNGGARPTACASDLDRVDLATGGDRWVPIVGGSVFVVLLAGGVYAVRRRRSRPAHILPVPRSGGTDGPARDTQQGEDIARV